MKSKNKNIALPMLDSETVIALIYKNIESIVEVDASNVINIHCDEFSKQNRYSNRSGASSTIEYLHCGIRKKKDIWLKQIKEPMLAYDALSAVFNQLDKNQYWEPVPKPLFYSEEYNLLATNKISGMNLKKLVLRYSFILNLFPDNSLGHVFKNIGIWLYHYNRLTSLPGKTETLREVIFRVESGLKVNDHFSKKEKIKLFTNLDSFKDDELIGIEFPKVYPHNDFTLRNLFVTNESDFYIIDWDAMIHSDYADESTEWWDLSCLYLNLQSLVRLSPLCRKNRLHRIGDMLIEGYFQESNYHFKSKYRNVILYIMTLEYYLGLNTDRPMYSIYTGNFGERYIKILRKNLLNGQADLLR